MTIATPQSKRSIWEVLAKLLAGKKKERVLILGSGWAGYAFARTLDPSKFERIVISPRSYFVFTPLLASTAVGTLEFRAVLEPIRRLKGARFHQGWADDIDFAKKVVRVEENKADDMSSRTVVPPPPTKSGDSALTEPARLPKGPTIDVPYDKLVIAVGAYSQTFGIEGVRQHAHFLRDIGDARRIRLRVLSLFEQCASPAMPEADRRKLLHFAVVGGGPTGIEFAAELHDLVHEDLAKLYPELMPLVRITVYDIAPKVLPMFDQALANYAMDTFRRQGIELKTEHHLQRIRPDEDGKGGLKMKIKEYGDEEIGAGIVVWSTGLMQNPLVEKLVQKTLPLPPRQDGEVPKGDTAEYRLEKDPKTGGIIIDSHLRARVTSTTGETARILPDTFVIGDCAVVNEDKSLPKTAQVASQEALYLAKAFNKGNLDEKPFKFHNWGTMTYLGNWRAIHQSNADEIKGRAAWILWRTAYLTKSMSIRNKVKIPFYWLVSWIFGRDVSRF
ncbi:putative external nadh-ubiquinone oxidoreductase mitochondrial precursor protein [Phaeoacremonium minimum UCRPA7]|uniref:Putative external nadh-ubiquinone oxidoreductase mitochondrial protein n=1 Tax=Phaeoacremonium minimum (strain UCR-PA7) TaxID=1286976 RepID=R8BET0_PHAM7|nr:putative external nadh-ubiquinone oxidoreductase mitochondrial precursor protein [Phaeoacremonium minimum UCRPA7]EON97806.1 putative external nadh-ubiquinone oxidoreductase mitochondrial precursor protein [Phaeoacremonium minimum UCRPA7]